MSSKRKLKKELSDLYYNLADDLYHVKESGSAELKEKADKLLDDVAEKMDEVFGKITSAGKVGGNNGKEAFHKLKAETADFLAKTNAEIEKMLN